MKNNDHLVTGQLKFVFRYVQKGEEFDEWIFNNPVMMFDEDKNESFALDAL